MTEPNAPRSANTPLRRSSPWAVPVHIYMGVFAERGAFGSVIAAMFRSRLPKRYHPGCTKRSSADRPPRPANDRHTNRCDRVRRANPASPSGSPRNTRSPLSFQFLQARRSVPKNASRQPIAASNGAKSRGALSAELRDPPTSPCSYPLPRVFFHHRTACSGSAAERRTSNGAASVGFLDCKPRSLLGTCRQFRTASRSVRAVPCASVSAAVCRVSRRADARAPMVVTVRVCPLCGARPLMGVLRVEGDSGKRFLLCSFCSQEWEFRRIHCPTCGEQAEGKLPVYVAEQLPHIRVEACDTCKFYLQTVDLTKDGHAIPLVDDLAAIPLTLWPKSTATPASTQSPGNIAGMRLWQSQT